MIEIDLTGKTALVTGAARGIGRTCALTLAQAGADISAIDVLEGPLAELAKEIEGLGRKVHTRCVDVTRAEDVEAATKEAVEALGKIDILVNNAGITRDNLIVRMKPDEWQKVIDVNLHGPFNFIKALSRPMMKARGGRIINIASIIGLVGNAGQANYAASKAGLVALTKTAAREYGSRGICVNAVAPGFIDTAMTQALDPKAKEAMTSAIPMGRVGKPEEIAHAVLFLASDMGAYITGQTLVVDGGISMVM
jgi:3-oxoacyl-[acyl-carrier protein] reductase